MFVSLSVIGLFSPAAVSLVSVPLWALHIHFLFHVTLLVSLHGISFLKTLFPAHLLQEALYVAHPRPIGAFNTEANGL